ncbi:MAG TPA: DUF2520 domain-containing protein, partial [Acidimicrobiales bacterium]
FSGLVRAAVDDAMALGPEAALTGPAARGDWGTISRHRAVLSGMAEGSSELEAYDAMVDLARRLVGAPAVAAEPVAAEPVAAVVTPRAVRDAA